MIFKNRAPAAENFRSTGAFLKGSGAPFFHRTKGQKRKTSQNHEKALTNALIFREHFYLKMLFWYCMIGQGFQMETEAPELARPFRAS